MRRILCFAPAPIRHLARRLALLAPLIALLAPPAFAASVADLVAERAARELGPAMPGNGRYDVRLPEDLPTEGSFIDEFWIDRKAGQFIANLVADSGDVRRIWGVAVLTVPIPVPTRRMLPDEIIAGSDIEIINLPWQRVNAYAVLDARDLVGKQVRRMLTQGRPVQLQSVIPPIVIVRGQKVMIELNRGPLRLTATGKAISDAYLGQEVRVVNLSSRKIIVGVARSDGKVEASY